MLKIKGFGINIDALILLIIQDNIIIIRIFANNLSDCLFNSNL